MRSKSQVEYAENLYGLFRDAKCLKTPKPVRILYPGCASEDRMSKAQYKKYGARAFPSGTIITLGGVTWTIK